MDGYATTREVAEHLRMETNTLDQWAYRKIGPSYTKIGGRRRYLWSDVEAWLKARKVNH